jgi:tRNA G26 N,N-dimethylase Trm1
MREPERSVRHAVLEQAQGMSRAEAKEKEELLEVQRRRHLAMHCFEGRWIAEDLEASIAQWRRVIEVMDAQGLDVYTSSEDPSVL